MNFDEHPPGNSSGISRRTTVRSWGIPYDIPIQILLYRQGYPRTARLAAAQDGPRVSRDRRGNSSARCNPTCYGTTAIVEIRPLLPAHRCCTWLWAYGGSFFGPGNRPTINDDRAVAAMEFMRTLVKYRPTEAITGTGTGRPKRAS